MPATNDRAGSQAWRSRAACAGTDDADAFYPDHSDEHPSALAICRRCPVSAECGLSALRGRERFGVWGGMTERDRERWWRRHGSRPAGPGAEPLLTVPVTSAVVAGEASSAEMDVEQRGA